MTLWPSGARWDRRTAEQLSTEQDAALRSQLEHAVGPSSPFWSARLAELGPTPASLGSAAALAGLPAVGERDLCPDGDPLGAAGLVLHQGEAGYATHASGPALRRALLRRIVAPTSYRAVVEADTRPTSYVFAGLALRYPVASTRADLDLVARAGARLWQVLGLTSADVVVSALPSGSTALVQGLWLAALSSGSPLLAPGDDPVQVLDVLSLVAATALVVPPAGGGDLLRQLADAGAPLSGLRTVLVGGAPDDRERDDLLDAVDGLGGRDVVVLAVHVPDGHRLLWGECRESAGRTGLHSYPDLELLQTVDPGTGDPAGGAPAELVLTQLGLRGSALLRWRTGDAVTAVDSRPCPACGRTVPRVTGTRRGALVPTVVLDGAARPVDLRAVAAVLSTRADVADWAVERGAGGAGLLVRVRAAGGGPDDLASAVAGALRSRAGVPGAQVVLVDRLAGGRGLSPDLWQAR